jgi:hypothetical protein
MANPPRGGDLHKVPMTQDLGKSTLISPSLSIPMPPGAATPPPPAPSSQGQGQSTRGTTVPSAQGSKRNG